ncbi:MAG: bifunctional diaminohydroxyphosphoribosylaminopyrimidine deaminase/5-amino-6-(5-phosphoribosylamino)uracil reductase RibD [Oceanipulchritudo sp.]
MDSPALTRMEQALLEAGKASGRTHPNPVVGAVIEHGGDLVARGFTQPAGEDHAEIVALKAFAEKGLRADATTTLTVTLEPCSTCGRTGPCTEAIIASGIRNVVVGTRDPNPAHAGRGIERLREAGVAVETGVLEAECRDLNLIFNWQMERGAPFIAAKTATTLDGRIATRGGLSRWITGPEARADVHRWRRYFPAIGVGAGTVLADDPSLTARIGGEPDWCPVRFVFDRNLVSFNDGIPRVYADAWKDRTIVVTNVKHERRILELEKAHGITFWAFRETMEDVGFSEFGERCREAGINGVYLEGGAHLLSSFLQHHLIHYLFAYRSPKLLADASALAPFSGQEPDSMKETICLEGIRHAIFGDDQLMRGYVVYPQ